MLAANFKIAYLIPNENGAIVIKQKGTPEQRIDDVSITFDIKNNCQVSFTNKYWRYNRRYEALGEIYFTYKVEEVLSQFIEELDIKTGFFMNKKVKKPYVKNGIIRLNKPEVIQTIRANTWYFEFNETLVSHNNLPPTYNENK